MKETYTITTEFNGDTGRWIATDEKERVSVSSPERWVALYKLAFRVRDERKKRFVEGAE